MGCRLTGVNAASGAAFSYDAAGRLQSLTANGLNTRFVYDGGQLTGEVDGNGVMIRRYVPLPGPDETLAMYDSTGVSYPLADSRGTPMAWTLANGQIAVQQYGAFGEEGPANIGRFGFTGQMRLPEIGLDYYKARFYDPSIGRFLTPDPAGYIDSPNLYAYVLNDPINFTDPSGLEAEENVSDPIDIFGRILTRGSASPGGGSQESRLGSGSFFHFLDPLADNGSQGPRMGEMTRMQIANSRDTCVNDATNVGTFVGTAGALALIAGVAVLSAPAAGSVALGAALVAGGAVTLAGLAATVTYFSSGDSAAFGAGFVGAYGVGGSAAFATTAAITLSTAAQAGVAGLATAVGGILGSSAGNRVGQAVCR